MNDFQCPKCHEHLRVGDYIVFNVKNKKKQRGLILLSPQIGNYTSIKHPSFELEECEYLEFYCPVCQSSLKSDIHENLAQVHMRDENGDYFDVYFSQIIGEHSTYKTSGDAFQMKGEHAGKYTFFKLGDKFKKYLR